MTSILGHDCCRGRWRRRSSMRTARRRQGAGRPFRLFQDSNPNEMELNEGDLWVEMYYRQARAATVGCQHPRPAQPLHPDVRRQTIQRLSHDAPTVAGQGQVGRWQQLMFSSEFYSLFLICYLIWRVIPKSSAYVQIKGRTICRLHWSRTCCSNSSNRRSLHVLAYLGEQRSTNKTEHMSAKKIHSL